MQLRSTIFSNPVLTSPCATGPVFLGAEVEEVVTGRLSVVVTEEVLEDADLGSGSGEAMVRVVASTTSIVRGEIMMC